MNYLTEEQIQEKNDTFHSIIREYAIESFKLTESKVEDASIDDLSSKYYLS